MIDVVVSLALSCRASWSPTKMNDTGPKNGLCMTISIYVWETSNGCSIFQDGIAAKL